MRHGYETEAEWADGAAADFEHAAISVGARAELIRVAFCAVGQAARKLQSAERHAIEGARLCTEAAQELRRLDGEEVAR
jgi:hypothetical protein